MALVPSVLPSEQLWSCWACQVSSLREDIDRRHKKQQALEARISEAHAEQQALTAVHSTLRRAHVELDAAHTVLQYEHEALRAIAEQHSIALQQAKIEHDEEMRAQEARVAALEARLAHSEGRERVAIGQINELEASEPSPSPSP